MITTVLLAMAVGFLHFFLEAMYVSQGKGVEKERRNEAEVRVFLS